MQRLTNRTSDGIAYVVSETGAEGVGYFTTQRRLTELISRLAEYEDEEEQQEKGCYFCNCEENENIEYCSLHKTSEYIVVEDGNLKGEKFNLKREDFNFCPNCGRNLRKEQADD